MGTKKFEELETKATQILYTLDTLTGDGATIHKRNLLHHIIDTRLCRLRENNGEEEVRTHCGHTLYSTLDGLEQMLNKANQFIAKVKGGSQ